MINLPIFAALLFINFRSSSPDKLFPNFSLEKLKHPLYQTSYLNPATDEFGADYRTAIRQQLEFEDFFRFNNFTNTNRTNAEGEKIGSYMPSFDTAGPYNWIPFQCKSSVDYKYESPIVGYINNGN